MRPPTFGWHEPVTQYGRRLGAIVDVQGQWIPVCSRRYRRLVARPTRDDAKDGHPRPLDRQAHPEGRRMSDNSSIEWTEATWSRCG
jgi:hypothetical protein